MNSGTNTGVTFFPTLKTHSATSSVPLSSISSELWSCTLAERKAKITES